MAEKRYYWLKLKEDYFNSPKIKKLRKIAGGDTYTIIYLKMQLLSVKNEGIIQFEGIEPTFEEELALKLDEDLENVKVTLSYLQSQALFEMNDNNQYLFVEANNNIGSEGQSAERKRKFDERKKEKDNALLCNASVTQEKRNSISIYNSQSQSNSQSLSQFNIEEEKEEEKSIFDTVEDEHQINNEIIVTYAVEQANKSKKQIETLIETYAEYVNYTISGLDDNAEEIKNLLLDWLKVRKAKRAKDTLRAIELNLRKLDKLATESNLNMSDYLKEIICRSWQAFYPINNYDKKQEKSEYDIAFENLLKNS